MKRKTVATRRKPFSRLTAAQKRVAIAKDVLAQIKLRRLIPTTGSILFPEGKSWEEGVDMQVNQKVLTTKRIKPCTACGVGLAFASAIRLFDSFDDKFREVGASRVTEFLSRYFDRKQLAVIETAFEKMMGVFNWALQDDDPEAWNKAKAFGSQYTDHLDRAVAIFTNIVKNKGTFKP